MCGSKSSSRQSTQNVDRRIGVTDQGQVAAEGGRIVNRTEIESVDAETVGAALEEGFSFGETAIGGAFGFGREALETVEASSRRAVEAVTSDQADDRQFFEAIATQGSEELQGLKSLLSTTAIVAGLGVAAVVFMRS